MCVPVYSTAGTDGGHATASILKESLRARKSASESRIPLIFRENESEYAPMPATSHTRRD